MRRQWTLGSIPMQMEKGNGKIHKSRLCFLSSMCASFWGLLFYYHFVGLGGSSIYGTTTLQSNPIRIEPLNSVSRTDPVKIEPTNVPPRGDVKLRSDPEAAETNVPSHSKIGLESRSIAPIPTEPADVKLSSDVKPSSVPIEVEMTNVVRGGKIDAESSLSDPSHIEPTNVPLLVNVKLHRDLVESDMTTVVGDGKIDVGPETEESSPRNPVTEDEAEQFSFMRALRTADDKSNPCGGRYIYVHNLPSRFNRDMLKDCRTLSRWTNMCKYTTNAGLGPPLKNVRGVFSKTGWYATNQFAVDVIFNNRMKQYECLTNDSSRAAAIFVPFYAGFDIARYLWGYNISTRDAASLDLVDWLMKRPEWKIMDGRDHFLVAGRITWDFRRLTDEESDWGSKLLFLPAARNMSMLVVESSPWNANDFAIPYPTYFHPAKDADVFFWQNRMRKLKREWLFSFAGAPRPGNPKSIRAQIIEQCKKSKMCKLLECDFGESKCHSPSSIMKMFQGSLFCLQPQGDSYTRRSAFDAMLAGCIPVFFHPGSAYTQYTWHLPKNYSSYSVFISENDVRKGIASIEETLQQISPQQVKRMRETVISLIPKLVYADPRSKLETFEDAFDVSVRAVIDKVTRLRKNIIQGRTEYDNFVEENSWKYALLEERQREVGAHEWDPFFSKPKEGDEESSSGSSAEAAMSSWKNEQRRQSR